MSAFANLSCAAWSRSVPLRAETARVAALVVLAAVVATGVVARAAAAAESGAPELPAALLLFGDEHDPNRPVPAVPEPKGKGIVAATLVAAGAAQVLEYDGPHDELAAVVVDVRLEAGSTTADLTAASVRARRRPAPDASRQAAGAAHEQAGASPADAVAALGVCVLSSDRAVTMTVAAGTRRAGWTVHIEDREFLCAEASSRLAMLMAGGGFRLSAGDAGEPGARLLVVLAAPGSQLSALELPGATVELAVAEAP